MRNMMEQALASTLIARRTSQYHKNQFALFKSGENYDCTIQVGCTDSTKQLFKCHRHVLAVASPAFNQMLHGQFQESKMGIDEPLSFPDVTPDAFKAAMNYVYGDDTTCLEKSLSLATSVFEFASKWQILDLGMVAAEICLNFELSANDLISLYEIFSLHNHPIEAERTMKMMCDRGSEVLKNLRDASKDTVKAILKQQSINIFSEKELLDAIAEWGASQIATSDASGKALSQDSSDEELLDVVEDSDFKGNALRTRALVCQLLKMVRFKAFSPRDFGFLFISGACPILTDKEKQNIFSRLQTGTGAVLASVKGFDLQSAWRGKFECEPKVLCLQGKLGSKEFSRMIWISPDVSDVYLLSVGLHSVCHLTSGAAVDALIELTLKGKGLSKVRFSGWCCKAETEDHWKGNMIRLTNLLQAGLTYELRVSGPKEPLHEFKLTETHYVVDFGAHLRTRVRCGGKGDVFALELARPRDHRHELASSRAIHI